MLVALLSDIHDHTTNLLLALHSAQEQGCSHLLFLGDMAETSTFRTLRDEWPHPIDLVFGNNEYEIKSLLKAYANPIVVLQGHYHCTRARQDENIVYITSPSLVTFPNAFRVININSDKNRTLVDVFLKETNLKDVQSRSKLRLFGVDSLYGTEQDRNTTFEIKNTKI